MTTENMTMDELMKDFDFKRIYKGKKIKGTVIEVTDKSVFVNINYSSDGIINKNELSNEEDINPSDVVGVGDEIEVMVLETNDGEGNVLLSKKRVDYINALEEISSIYNEHKKIILTIKEEVKGGLIAFYKGIRIFIPASQCSGYGKIDIKTLIGKDIEVEIIEFDRPKKRIVASRRIIDERIKEQKRLEEQKIREERKIEAENAKKALWNSLEKGEKRKGKVVRLVKFGAFVDIGGIEGLVHNNDLSWKRISDPSEIVKVNDEVEVFVQDFDIERNRLSLALKEINNHPWDNLNGKYKANDIVLGTVVKFMNFGAFVEVEPAIQGLVHISEITEEHIAKPSEVLEIGQKVKVKILDIDQVNHKMALSIKEAIEKPKEYLQYINNEEEATLGDLFKDALSKLNLK